MAYYYKGDYKRAVSSFTKLLKTGPENEDAYNWRGAAKRELKDYDGAITDFADALKLNPKDTYPIMEMGNAYYIKGDYRIAVSYFKRMIEA